MSFGGVVVDHINRTERFPYRAMLTGLIANALGWSRRDTGAHEELQSRVRYAARIDHGGGTLVDYQTVVLDSGEGWTTWGQVEERAGAGGDESTHIRYRHYLVDTVVSAVLSLEPEGDSPTLDEVGEALRMPARPLFIGRKCCIPSGPVWLGMAEASSLRAGLCALPLGGADRGSSSSRSTPLRAIVPADEAHGELHTTVPRVEDRDWANNIHVGRRFHAEILLPREGSPGEHLANSGSKPFPELAERAATIDPVGYRAVDWEKLP